MRIVKSHRGIGSRAWWFGPVYVSAHVRNDRGFSVDVRIGKRRWACFSTYEHSGAER